LSFHRVYEEILGGKKGEYKLVHPNNHVNMSQSSNDVVPTSIRIMSIRAAKRVIAQAEEIRKILLKKSTTYKNTVKIGRTHLQDAVPGTYGQTFAAWREAIEKDIQTIEEAIESISELGIGGTATGSGITTHPKFREMIVKNIKKYGEIEVRPTKDTIETTQNMNDMLRLSCALRCYATTLNRIANDIRLLVSGPKGGIAEVWIPEVEPGSSIMPGKVNPSVPEAINMICWKVMGNDQAISLAAQSGQLELNFGTPLIGQCLFESTKMLENGSKAFGEECLEGLKIDEKRTSQNFNSSLCYATAFNPYLGYSKVSKLVREALDNQMSLKDLIVQKGILSIKDVEKIIESATGPSLVDEEIKKRIKL
jgi:aspartate ammonia-lyase